MSVDEGGPLQVSARDAEHGQTMAEYAVVLGIIVLVTVLVFVTLGDTAGLTIQDVTDIF